GPPLTSPPPPPPPLGAAWGPLIRAARPVTKLPRPLTVSTVVLQNSSTDSGMAASTPMRLVSSVGWKPRNPRPSWLAPHPEGGVRAAPPPLVRQGGPQLVKAVDRAAGHGHDLVAALQAAGLGRARSPRGQRDGAVDGGRGLAGADAEGPQHCPGG